MCNPFGGNQIKYHRFDAELKLFITLNSRLLSPITYYKKSDNKMNEIYNEMKQKREIKRVIMR